MMRIVLFAVVMGGAVAQSPLAPPVRVDPGSVGIGGYVPAPALEDLQGGQRSWREGAGTSATVLAFFSATCPLSRRFGPELAAFEAAQKAAGVGVVFVDVGRAESVEEAASFARAMGWQGLVLRDVDLGFARAVRGRTTTEVFFVDATGTLLYRGAFSDQYGADHALPVAKRAFLADALRAHQHGLPIALSATHAPGCALEYDQSATANVDAPTYTRDIARLIERHCAACHRDGGVGPFSLRSFADVERRATMIATVIEAGRMPPWFAEERLEGDAPSRFRHAGRLSQRERDLLQAWIAAGKPEGLASEAPALRSFAEGGWSIGEPDLIAAIPEPIAVPARGTMPYQHKAVRIDLPEDRWIQAMQVLPSDRSVVHHALIFAVPESALAGERVRLRDLAAEGQGFFAAYVPGQDTVIYPEGYAKRLPAGSALVFQIHYTPNGVATEDRIQLGLKFAKAAPERIVRTAGIMKRDLRIPPGIAGHEERTQVAAPQDLVLLAFLPHMHIRGQAFRYELERASGARETLLDIPRYDFDWQLRYELAEPIRVSAGERLHLTARFDNSADNPNNPDPSRTVRWGPMTDDEMMIGYIEYYLQNEDPAQPDDLSGPLNFGRGLNPAALERLVRRLDRDQDGRLSKDEVPARFRARFDAFDADRDGHLSREEWQKLAR